ncbi:hypothetical protein HAX54_047223 [Datura stramonium]|uniref:Uncharacterized protein n=1 Tax=Datura stramonium TaxID=4076 RepID=A0ABS8WLX0_DATST|nr:hypothetical protein [Datura stramonium]
MNATWVETSNVELEGEDVENHNLSLMTRSDLDSDNDSTKISLSDLKTQVHSLSKRKMVKLSLSLMDECQQMSVEKIEKSKIFSNMKFDYKVLKGQIIEFEDTNKTPNAEISKFEETVSVQKVETTLQESEDEHEIGLIQSSAETVSAPSLTEGTCHGN